MARPDLHTDEHDDWDRGGTCMARVAGDDGYADACGYKMPYTEDQIANANARADAIRSAYYKEQPVIEFGFDAPDVPGLMYVTQNQLLATTMLDARPDAPMFIRLGPKWTKI